MGWLSRRRYGRLDMQLALILAAVAIGAVVATSAIAAATIVADANKVLTRQEAAQTRAAAVGAGVTYRRAGWVQALAPVIAIADRSGEALQVRDQAGRVVRSTSGFARFPPGPTRMAPVRAAGRLVGSVTVKFGDRGIGKLLAHFEARRWQVRLIAAGVGGLFAVAVALLVAPLIAGPVDRLIRTARARGGGQLQARVGQVRGLADLPDLAVTFDEMADAIDEYDRRRRSLVAYLAHELRTPIAVLQASTEAMMDHVVGVTPDQVASLHDEAVRLGELADRLQELASAEAAAAELAPGVHDLAAIVTGAADSLTVLFRNAGIGLRRQLAPVPVRCDPARMRAVVTNLLTNAAKFTPADGRVLLETAPSGDQAMLRVSDTGTGIAPEDLSLVTRRFYRGRAAADVSGSGLGLAIVDEVVRAHQGTMDISSEPGKGTQVTIRLPRAA